MTSYFELVMDPYERKARVVPGLLVTLPVLVPLLCVYGAKHPLLTAVTGLLVGCGAIFALANIARGRGKQLEEMLIAKWGGIPSTIALRHRDKFLDSISKKRYHEAIRDKLGISMPTAEEESACPDKADDIYAGAIRQLRELTRSSQQLLMQENIAYGFHRNMVAMRPVGIVSCLLGITHGMLIANVLQVASPYFDPAQFADPGLAAVLTFLISFALLAAWLLYFDQDIVRRMGFIYAERLLECLPYLPSSAPRKKEAKLTVE